MQKAYATRDSGEMLVHSWDTTEKGDLATISQEPNIHQHDSFDADLSSGISLLTRNLLLFTVLKTIGSFDSGAFSAALGAENGIAEEWGLGTVRQGTLSSSVFLGNILGCPLSGHMFSHYSAKRVLVCSLILHTAFTFFFATITNYVWALLCRFLIGITLSFVIVYTPVWVDIFAPRDRQSVWMASHNAGVPLGIMLGYTCGAFLPSYTNINWEWAFYIKCIFTIPAMAYLMRVDSRSIDRPRRNRTEAAPTFATSASADMSATERVLNVLHSNFLLIWSSCVPLFRNKEYMCSTLSMCSLYFVVTGLQNFLTQYLRADPFNASMKTIMIGFGGAVVTAPVLGVIAGGVLLDRIGGYQRNLRRVTAFICAWGSVTAFLSIMCIFVTDTITFLIVMSIVLFCGGAIIPPGSGMVVTSVPEHLRPAGAAFSQMMYNLLGNFSGPMVCGYVAQWTGQLRYGIYTILGCSSVGLVPMLVLLYKAWSTPDVSTPSLPPLFARGRYPQRTAVGDDSMVMMGGAKATDGMRGESPRIGHPSEEVLPVSVETATRSASSSSSSSLSVLDITAAPINSKAVVPNSVISLPKKFARAKKPAVTPFVAVNDRPASSHEEQEQKQEPAVTFTEDETPEIVNILSGEEVAVVCKQPDPGENGVMNGYGENLMLQREALECLNNELDFMMEADAAQMMSFPNQHNFGLDILFSLLSSTSRRHASSRRGSSHVAPSNTEQLEDADVDSATGSPRGGSDLNAMSRSQTPEV
ncbi:hypothetical protein MOQ_000140 [Trypanosoma cruzi marinkellei]|uniref:Major facilitator superfamily (MFS) profile domain-containing protein n=1 Tax=Trypanosoma cruzi marinkellei TaxID=85056 RepID=K2MWP8_TRYCR|nr:hypothetical protein MOQ_000140 [Trypanosoma cruzi marinkellei]